MHLLIRAVSLAGQPLTQAISAYFDERGGTIGRSDTNTLALPDPERRISRLQAELSRTPDGWRILNVGNANPIWHNNRPVPPGEGVLLDEGDELQIGTYALRVNYSQNDETARTITKGRATIDSRIVIAGSGQEPKTDSGRMGSEGRASVNVPAPVSPAPAAPTAVSSGVGGEPLTLPSFAMPPRPAPAAPAPAVAAPAASPFADLLGDLSSGSASLTPPGAGPAPSSASPFADILGFGAAPSPSPRSASGAAPSPAPAGVSRLPDDFDPFADLSAPRSPSGRPAAPTGGWDLPRSAPAASPTSPFDLGGAASALPGDLDLMGSVQPAGSQSIDQLFGLGGSKSAASQDPLADFLKKTEPGAPADAPVGTPSSVDPLALLASRENIADARPSAPSSGATLPDDVPELNAAMSLPPVVSASPLVPPVVEIKSAPLPSSSQREPMSASFSFMSPKSGSSAGSSSSASSSPFADMGLGASAPSGGGLLDDLDIRPQAVPDTPPAPVEEDSDDTRPGDLDFAFDLAGRTTARVSAAPIETQLAPEDRVAAMPSMPHVAAETPSRPFMAEAALMPTPAPEASAPMAADPAQQAGQAADQAALWAAFCEGAGVKFVPPQGLNPDLMRVIGQVLRNAVDGSLKLVAARAATKSEMRAEVTVIQARRNNPLKFSPDTQSAMEQLLQPPLRGFMSGPEAVADAMDDLLGHTIGTMVGMRAALEGVLGRFEPAQLESKLVGHSMLDSLLPMNRRAKLWELYLQHYDAVRTEAQDDFHNLFGRAFLQAYEEQLDRLYAERREAGRAPGSTA